MRGSAGIGAVLIRHAQLTGDARRRQEAEMCFSACAGAYSNKIWQMQGLAGFGELVIDMFRFTGDERYLEVTREQARTIVRFAMPRPEGIALPGLELMRVSCDWGMGMAGTAMFLHRLLHPQLPRVLTLDPYFEALGCRSVPMLAYAEAMQPSEADSAPCTICRIGRTG